MELKRKFLALAAAVVPIRSRLGCHQHVESSTKHYLSELGDSRKDASFHTARMDPQLRIA